MNTSSRIDAVTVYRQGALVTRLIDLDAAQPLVRVTNLPLCMDDTSVRLEVEGQAVARDVRIVLELPQLAGDEELEPATDVELEAAWLAEQKAKAALEAIEEELSRLGELELGPRPTPEEGKPPIASPTEGRLGLLAFQRVEVKALLRARVGATERRREAHEQRIALQLRRRDASVARQAREGELRKTAVVGLCGDGPARIRLSYLVPGACWAPSYALRLASDLGKGELAVRALVWQRSGEDWTGVRLTLSTAAAQGWSELPELRSVRIGRAQRLPPPSWRPPPAGTDSLFLDYDRSLGDVAASAPPMRRPAAAPEPAEMAYEPSPAAEPPPPQASHPALGSVPFEAKAQFAARARSPGFGGMAPPSPKKAKRHGLRSAQAGSTPAGGFQYAESEDEEATDGGPLTSELCESEPCEPRVEMDEQLLDYGRLRMPAPGHPLRGHLRRATAEELHAEMGASAQAAALLRVSLASASEVGARPPSGHRLVRGGVAGFDYAVHASHPVDLPADGAFHSVPLLRAEGACAPRYVCVPRESTDVFRQVELENPLTAPLLAGPVDVSLGDAYLLTAEIRDTPARGAVRLGLGVEQAIKVARNARYTEESTGLISSRQALVHDIEVDLQNHLSQPAQIEVRERIPVTWETDSDVEVLLEEVKPGWEAWEPDESSPRGLYRWRVSVPPGGEPTRLTARYRIEIPGKHELVGGNRREP